MKVTFIHCDNIPTKPTQSTTTNPTTVQSALANSDSASPSTPFLHSSPSLPHTPLRTWLTSFIAAAAIKASEKMVPPDRLSVHMCRACFSWWSEESLTAWAETRLSEQRYTGGKGRIQSFHTCNKSVLATLTYDDDKMVVPQTRCMDAWTYTIYCIQK